MYSISAISFQDHLNSVMECSSLLFQTVSFSFLKKKNQFQMKMTEFSKNILLDKVFEFSSISFSYFVSDVTMSHDYLMDLMTILSILVRNNPSMSALSC